jgi:hypothetical protein
MTIFKAAASKDEYKKLIQKYMDESKVPFEFNLPLLHDFDIPLLQNNIYKQIKRFEHDNLEYKQEFLDT